MKNELQNLILERISELAQESDKLLVTLSVKTTTGEKIDTSSEVYPINRKVTEISRWIDAMIEENED